MAALFADKSAVSGWGVCRECRIEQCPEVLRAKDAADRLRALLARALEHVPADDPMAAEGRAALD
jgi:hypothetical protein